MSEQKIILPDSPEAASIQTVTGWVSRTGRFYGSNENAARYDGSTHKKCERCGDTYESISYCKKCYKKYLKERLARMPRKKWDGEAMLLSSVNGRIFSNLEDAHEHLAPGASLESLKLVICEPVYAELSLDYFSDDLPDDCVEPPSYLVAAIAAFNDSMRIAPPLSWQPGKYALDCSMEQEVGAA